MAQPREGQLSERGVKRSAARDVRAEQVAAVACELEEHGRLGLTRAFMQHGDISVYDHVCAVACASLGLADALERIGVRCDRDSLVRGALLHDYFLYDWHTIGAANRFHAWNHPFIALRNAEEDFDLTARERTIIVRHMFPLVPIPPTCREAWIVCVADKACALRETAAPRVQALRARRPGRPGRPGRPRRPRPGESAR